MLKLSARFLIEFVCIFWLESFFIVDTVLKLLVVIIFHKNYSYSSDSILQEPMYPKPKKEKGNKNADDG